MVNKLEIAGVHTKLDERIERYVMKKIGRLDHYVPRHARESLHIEVRLKDTKAKDNNHCSCEVVVHLPHETISTCEATVNMYAAIDIVETKLKIRLKKYKDLHTNPRLHRRVIAHFKRQMA